MPESQLYLLSLPICFHQRAAKAHSPPRQQQAICVRHLQQEVHNQTGAYATQEEARQWSEQRQRGEQRGGGGVPLPPDLQRQRGQQAGGQGAGLVGRAGLEEQEVKPDGHDQQAVSGKGKPRQEIDP